MRKLKAAALALLIALGVSAPCFADEVSADARITVARNKGGFELTVPLSHLIMSIPAGNLEQRTDTPGFSDNGPRYFYLEDKSQGLIISGWFDPENKFPGVKQLWEHDTDAWKKHDMPEPLNVLFEKIGKWEVIAYDNDLPGTNNTHLRAQWVGSGTWIDIHISLTSKLPNKEGRAKLEAILKTIQVREKGI